MRAPVKDLPREVPAPVPFSRGLGLAALAVLFFSTSPVLVRWAQGLSAFEITAGRMLTAGVVVLALARITGQPLPGRAEWPRFVGYGLVAAAHFGFYVASLAYTSIAHSLAITYTAPIFVALFSRLFLGEGLDRRKGVGVVIAVAGIAILAGFEPVFTQRMLVGDLLALGSAVTFGLYSVAGRWERSRFGLFAYAGTVYALAGVWLLPLALWQFSPAGYTAGAVASVLALGLIPLALGHTLYNAALRRTPATLVNLIATQEVTFGILLGVLLLSEMPSLNSLIGALVTLAGIALVLL
jgi:drug/metabolite transporter (DMT)-like permease